jgi:hypothetical protein
VSELESELERLIDSQSLGVVLAALIVVCRIKSDNGNPHATAWNVAAGRLMRIAEAIERLGI